MTSPRTHNLNTIVHSITHEVPDLTEEEKRQLEAVLQKAKAFDEEEANQNKKPLEGQLYKYTNVVKGWQFRWFILTPETGMLEYYMMEEAKKNRPKGGLHLAGAVILPSEDDDHSFSVNAVCGELYKLKATNARERQFWVNRLRETAQQHSSTPFEIPAINSRVHRSLSQSPKETFTTDQSPKCAPILEKRHSGSSTKDVAECGDNNEKVANSSTKNSLASIKECVQTAASNQKALASIIEQLPIDGPHLKCSDSALLLLKATSQATIQSLEYCYLILKQRELARMHPKGLPSGATIQWVDIKKPLNETLKK